jgi:hypothetical protein
MTNWWWESVQTIGALASIANTLMLLYLCPLMSGVARRERHYLEIIKQRLCLAGSRADESSDLLEEVGKDVKETARKVDNLTGSAFARTKPTNSTAHA